MTSVTHATYLIAERTFLVSVAGSLDERTAPLVAAEVGRLVDEGARELVLDLLDVTAVDPVGVDAVVAASWRASRLDANVTVVCDDDVLGWSADAAVPRFPDVVSTVTEAFAGVAARSEARASDGREPSAALSGS